MNRRIAVPENAKRRSELALFLKFLRQRVDPDVRALGPYERLPWRLGKRLTQAELAEAIGVSREWYAVLESSATTRASPGLLDSVADVLMLTPDERARLFQLGVPEVWRVPQRATEFQPGVPELSSKALERRHGPILQAFASMRLSAKRLWSASTVGEALSLAAEELASHFGDAALVGFAHRLAQGRWYHSFVVDRGIGTRNARFHEELASSLTPARYDEIVLYPTLLEPGDVGTLESFAATSVADVYETERVKHNIHRWVLLAARIRSRHGAIGNVMMKHAAECEYSEVDRAVISAIASVASLALS